MRKVKYLLVFICLMLVSCNDRYYNQTDNVMVVNSVTAISDKSQLYELHISTPKKYYWVLELIDEAGKYNVGDTLIIIKK